MISVLNFHGLTCSAIYRGNGKQARYFPRLCRLNFSPVYNVWSASSR